MMVRTIIGMGGHHSATAAKIVFSLNVFIMLLTSAILVFLVCFGRDT